MGIGDGNAIHKPRLKLVTDHWSLATNMRAPGYNSPHRMISYHRLLVAVLALSLLSSAHAADTWQSPSADLAKQIAALTGPGTITLAIVNRSSITNDDLPVIRHSLEHELRSAGVIVREKGADTDVRVTLSQNQQGWLWVAEVREGSETNVAMLPVSGAVTATPASSAPQIALRASLLYAQSAPILDVVILGAPNDQHMAVLDPERIRIYAQAAGSWQLAQSFDINHAQPFPRDLRGRISPAQDHLFDAYLPGVVCAATKAADSWTITMSCSDSDDPWPLLSQKAFYNPARNFFTGVLVPGFGPKLPPFYSAAEIARTGGTTFLVADVNGAVHILEGGSHKLLIGARDWGSDIAAVRSQCGSGTQVIASAAGWPVADSVRAYEVSGREATPVSAPLNFDGIITALWAAADKTSTTVVVQKPQETAYEAYNVSVVCNR